MLAGTLPQPEFWRGKRVLVTGHTGFKGTWMCLWLRRLGAEVSGLSLRPDADGSLFTDCFRATDPLSGHIADLRDFAAVRDHLDHTRPEVVMHLAAQAVVRRSLADPIETYATNVMGTVHVLEAVRRQPAVRAVVNVTSDKCYQNNEWVWPYRETDRLGGKDPYSSSKACAELVGEAFRQSYFGSSSGPFAASARAGNVVGGGDWAQDRLVPDCIRAFRRGEAVVIRNPNSVRPWQHVLEPIAGYLVLAQRLYEQGQAYAEAWNFGPDSGNAVKVSEVVGAVTSRWGGQARAEMPGTADTTEAILLQVDSAKARALLGWRPRLNLDATIDWTVDWYRRRASGESGSDLCLEQIQLYEAA